MATAPEDPTQYFHMNTRLLVDGDEIVGTRTDKVHPRIEEALDARRPSHLLSRRDAVYTLKGTDFSRCGIINPGYIYRVGANVEPQLHDLAWIGPMQKAILKEKYVNREGMKNYPDWSSDLADDCCKNYWAGTPSSDPTWEALFPRCVVIAKLSDDRVDPASTKGGWKIPS